MPFPSAALFPGPAFPGSDVRLKFTPPFVVRQHVIDGGLRGSLQYGLAVLRINGEWVETEFPTWEQEQDAELYFRGGSTHVVDPDTATALAAAGYEVVEADE